MTATHGLPQYEISNHARRGEESQHNLIYWRYGEYAGLGPGAHGRILVDGQRTATVAERAPEAWLERVEARGHGLVEQTAISAAEAADEMLLMGLRLNEGLDLARLARITGYTPGRQAISDLSELGLLETFGNSRIRASGQGRFVLNGLVGKLSESFTAVE